MIKADLHNHTSVSHGANTAREMYQASRNHGLEFFGLSEHSPLPPGFSCALYTGDLEGGFPGYVRDVLELKAEGKNNPAPLLGLELDWLPSRLEWMRDIASRWPFDYKLGSLHYLDGFSVGNAGNWNDNIKKEERFARFSSYFYEMANMVKSGIINMASHPDFIKLRAWNDFQLWLDTPQSRDSIAYSLDSMVRHNVAMEVSSAGLRQDFAEPYPCPEIMRMAKQTGCQITFGSDAHRAEDIAKDFDWLADYASSFGFSHNLVFINGEAIRMRF